MIGFSKEELPSRARDWQWSERRICGGRPGGEWDVNCVGCTVHHAHHKQNLCKTKSEQHQDQPHVQGTSWPPPIPSSSARRSPRRGDPRRSGRSPWWLRASSPAVKYIIILKWCFCLIRRMLLTHPDQSLLFHPRQISLQLAGWSTVLPIDIGYRWNIGGIQFYSIQFHFIKRIFLGVPVPQISKYYLLYIRIFPFLSKW